MAKQGIFKKLYADGLKTWVYRHLGWTKLSCTVPGNRGYTTCLHINTAILHLLDSLMSKIWYKFDVSQAYAICIAKKLNYWKSSIRSLSPFSQKESTQPKRSDPSFLSFTTIN